MAEQVSTLLQKKVPATFINSDLDRDEKRLRYNFLGRGLFKFLYLAPERFFVRDRSEANRLRQLRPSFLVIDEAHCIDQWGPDFRPEYARLKEIRASLGNPPVLAFTATAGREMQERILRSLGLADAAVFVRGVDRPNIALLRWKVPRNDRSNAIAQLCAVASDACGKMMVFVPTVKVGEELQRDLARAGHDLPFYHSRSGNTWEREQLVKRFLGESEPRVDRIICTNAFGMGLDVPNVRLVVHWQQPASIEDYMQEFGRAGRDGLPSVAVLLYGDRSDRQLLEFMASKAVSAADMTETAAAARRAHKRTQIAAVAKLAQMPACFRRELITYFEDPTDGRRRTLAMRLLDWVFSNRASIQRNRICCDSCNSSLLKKAGPVGFVRAAVAPR